METRSLISEAMCRPAAAMEDRGHLCPSEMCVHKGFDFEEASKLVAEIGSTAPPPSDGNPRRTKKQTSSQEDGLSSVPTLSTLNAGGVGALKRRLV
jgi:hypothetical protein